VRVFDRASSGVIREADRLPLPADVADERVFPRLESRAVEAFRSELPVALAPPWPLPVFALLAAAFPAFAVRAVALRAAVFPGEDLPAEDFPEAVGVLLAAARPAVFFAAGDAPPADFAAPGCFVAVFLTAREDEGLFPLRLADEAAEVPLPAVAFLPVGAATPGDFILPVPLPLLRAVVPALALVDASACWGVALPAVLARLRDVAVSLALPAAAFVGFPAADLAPVVLPAAFRGLVVAMRVSRRNPLRCLLQRTLR
jgi:hypothetical protein